MSYRSLFLISLGTNVLLGFCLWQRLTSRPASLSREPATSLQSSLLSASLPGPAPSPEQIKQFGWESVEAPDYKQYIANLRAVGCPEETIRDIIEADVTKLYDEKKKQVRKAAPRFEYWKGDSFLRGMGREAWLKMHALDDERDQVLRDLGVEPDYSKQALKQQNANDWMFDFLSDEKRREIARLRRKLGDALAMRDQDTMNQAQAESLLKEHEAVVKRLLTPEEAFQYDLRVSPAANGLRNETRYMDPTEEEFMALYKLRAAHQRDLQPLDPKAPEAERRAAREREKEYSEKLQEQIKQTLGSDRYAEYQMSQDWRYAFTYNFGQKAGLGASEMKQVYLIRKEAEHAAEQVERNSILPVATRDTALQAIRHEAERAMSGAMGQQIWGQYQSQGHDGWLNSISKTPVTP